MSGWTNRRRRELLELLDRFNPSIDQLTEAVEQEAQQRPEVQRLQTHPGVGHGKQVGSYLGLVPCEDFSADHWRVFFRNGQ